MNRSIHTNTNTNMNKTVTFCSNINLYTGKQCKNISNFNIGVNSLCMNHCRLLYTKHVLIIQKSYRGYKCRKYLNNIFTKLPSDLQDIILKKINKDLYYRRHCKIISKIIYNRTYRLHNYRFNLEYFSIHYILNCYNLYSKYHTIIGFKYLKHMKILGEQLLYLCECILNNDNSLTYYSIYFNLNLNTITHDQCNQLHVCITKYLLIFYYYYYYYY